eukprot:EG_transcript_26975
MKAAKVPFLSTVNKRKRLEFAGRMILYDWSKVNLLTPWPPQSPDLNPVEHCWAWLASRLVGKRFSSCDELWTALQREWSQAPPTLIPNLYGSMVRRLTAVQVAKGLHTRY